MALETGEIRRCTKRQNLDCGRAQGAERDHIRAILFPLTLCCSQNQKPAILKVVRCRRQTSRLPLSPEQVTMRAPGVSACSLQAFTVSLRSTPLLLCTQHSGHPPTVYRRWPPPFGVARCPHIQHSGASCQEKLRAFL